MYDWVLFFNEDRYDFPDAFKHALSTQLHQQLAAEIGCPGIPDDYFFNLFVGMADARIEIRDGYTFANVEIIGPDSVSRPITIAWNQDAGGAYRFYFCDDFPVDELKAYIVPKQQKQGNTFGTHIDDARFPDLSVRFDTIADFTPAEKQEIAAMLRSVGVYVSDFMQNTLLLDFQSPDRSDAQIRGYIDAFIGKLQVAALASKIKSVTIA